MAEFRAVFASDLGSLIGDQVAAVALAVLLYQRSGSPLMAALGYAAGYVPWLVGGPLLAAWADRLPARRVLVGCDLIRAALMACAAIPGLPLAALGLIVLTSAMLAPPFDSARSALMPQILTGDRYAVGMSAQDAVHQSAQLVGFAGGGALVLLLEPHRALGLNAITFLLSALLLGRGLTARPAAQDDDERGTLLADTMHGLRLVGSDPRLRGPLALGVAGAAYGIVPEALAPAYAHELGHGAVAVGLIMASVASGAVAGGLLLARAVSPELRQRLARPLALAGTLPLLVMMLRPDLTTAIALLAVCGLTSAYQVAANAAFAKAAPAHARARAFGVAMAAMCGGQAVAIVLAGAAAQVARPSTVIAGAGVLGAVAVLLATRASRRRPAHLA